MYWTVNKSLHIKKKAFHIQHPNVDKQVPQKLLRHFVSHKKHHSDIVSTHFYSWMALLFIWCDSFRGVCFLFFSFFFLRTILPPLTKCLPDVVVRLSEFETEGGVSACRKSWENRGPHCSRRVRRDCNIVCQEVWGRTDRCERIVSH